MRDSYSGYRVLLVHAHPDDETINNGATMALYAARGAQVTLITCTRGEEGDILTPELTHLASSATDTLGEHREIELSNSMKALGITDFRFLAQGEGKYRDSGMMGTEPNNRPDVFWQADLEEASDYLVTVIEEVKPHILITYDELGGYGHPDHIQAHRVAMRASEKSKWQIQKIYWNTMPKSVLAEGMVLCNQSAFWLNDLHKKIGFLNENYQYSFDFDWFLRLLKNTDAGHVPRIWGGFRKYKNTKTYLNKDNFTQENITIVNKFKVSSWEKNFFRVRRFFLLLLNFQFRYVLRGLVIFFINLKIK